MGIVLNIQMESVEVKASRPVIGNISLSIGDVYFPGQNWNDFVLVFLRWWMSALRKLSTRISNDEIVSFMDGPYSVEIVRISNEIVALRAMDESCGRRLVVEGEVLLSELLQEATAISNKLLNVLSSSDWWSEDAEDLSRLTRDSSCGWLAN